MRSIDFLDYQIATRDTAIYPEAQEGSFNALAYVTLGLSNEAGEVAGKVKKIWRDNEGEIGHEAQEAIAAELGDVLWYLARVADELGVDFESVAAANLAKLNSRRERGVIGGSGDDR